MNEKARSRNPVETCVLFAIETSFTADYLDTLSRLGVKLAAGILTSPPLWSLRGIPVVLHPQEVSALLLEIPVALCSVTPKHREEAHLRALSLGFTRFTSLIDPTAIISNSIHRGQGLFLNANVALAGEVELDDFVTVNRSASVGHHTVLGTFATVGPGTTIASQCKIGKRVMIGAGAVVGPSVTIGDGATVAAGAVVFRDVDPGATVLGNPARIARRGSDETADSSL